MLPNLPGLVGQWITSLTEVTTDPAGWVQIAAADPTRWTIGVKVSPALGILLWTTPDIGFSVGYDLNPSEYWFRNYKDYGPLVQGEWYVYGKGAAGLVIVELASIRPPSYLTMKGE